MFRHTFPSFLSWHQCSSRLTPYLPIRAASTSAVNSLAVDPESDAISTKSLGIVEPPMRKHRTELTLLKALSASVGVNPICVPYYLPKDSHLLSNRNLRICNLARASGAKSARFFLQEQGEQFAGLRNDVPYLQRFAPVLRATDVMDRVASGEVSCLQGIDMLVDLVEPEVAWKLYDSNKNENISSKTLHRLLDLLCATNGDTYTLDQPSLEFFYMRDRNPVCRHLNTEWELRLEEGVLEKMDQEMIVDKREEEGEEPSSEEAKEPISEFPVAQSEVTRNSRVWKPNGPAERLFHQLPEETKTAAAYQSMIRGASKHFAADRAWQLAEEMREVGHAWTLPVYNALLRCSVFLQTPPSSSKSVDYSSSVTRMQTLLTDMQTNGIQPDLATFNNALFSLKDQTETKEIFGLSFSLLREMEHLGVEPSFGTYAHLIALTCCQKKMANVNLIYLNDIINQLETRDSSLQEEVRSPDDYMFFMRAMSCAMISCNADIILADRIHALLQSGNRSLLQRSNNSITWYYIHYFMCIYRRGSLDRLMELWNSVVPYYIDRGYFLGPLLSHIQSAKGYKEMLQLWKEFLSMRIYTIRDMRQKIPIHIISHFLDYMKANIAEIPVEILTEAMRSLEEAYTLSTNSSYDLKYALSGDQLNSAVQICLYVGAVDVSIRLIEAAGISKCGALPTKTLFSMAEACLSRDVETSTMVETLLPTLLKASSEALSGIGVTQLQALAAKLEAVNARHKLMESQSNLVEQFSSRIARVKDSRDRISSSDSSSSSDSD